MDMPLNSFLYSIPYIIIFVLLWFFYLNEIGRIENGFSSKYARNISFLLILGFIGLRGHLYSDFISYYPFFENLPTINKLDDFFQEKFEPGFVIYSSIIKTIIPNYFVWVFINTLLDLVLLRLVFKRYTDSLVLPFIFFLAYQGLIIEFNLYQNSKAIVLFLLSLPYLKQRKLIPYILLNLLGASFHIGAVIYIPFYFILQKELPRWLVWSMLIIANVIFLGGINITSSLILFFGNVTNQDLLLRVLLYQDMGNEYVLSFGYLERTFSILVLTILYKKLIKQNSFNRILYNCALFYYFTFMLLSDIRVFSERIPLMFIFSYWILFSNIAVLKFKFKRVIFCFLIIISFLKIFVSSQHVMSYYDNLLWGIKDYEERRQNSETFFNK
jgi:hypothetical protein